jgi:ParB-like chromosome segregation protein Spo0J
MNIFNHRLTHQFSELLKEIEIFSIEDKIEIINDFKKMLHEISPMKSEPVDCIIWVKSNEVHANDYNPNSVAPPEMKLLQISIQEDGYTQPIVTMLEESGNREVIDGFHRHRVGKESSIIQNRIHGYLPVVTINTNRTDKSDRIAATIRHNRARGKHKVDAMSEIVVDLKKRNWSDEKIGRELGMDPDEVLRLCQISGIAEMFQDKEFSEAWQADAISEDDSLLIFEENE